jgi:hypothetical protein
MGEWDGLSGVHSVAPPHIADDNEEVVGVVAPPDIADDNEEVVVILPGEQTVVAAVVTMGTG